MFEFITVVIFVWLLVKAVSLIFQITWGIAKVVATILIGLALPVLFVCVVFIGGIALLVPIIMIAIAAGILKACL